MTPKKDAPAEGTNNSGRNNLSGGTPQKYEISATGRTLTFRAVGTPQRRFTGKLATDLHAALRQWYGIEEGGAE